MKRNNRVLIASVLFLAAQNTVMSNEVEVQYPGDAEANFSLPPLDTYADRMARMGEQSETWAVGKREQSADPYLAAFGISRDSVFPSHGHPISD